VNAGGTPAGGTNGALAGLGQVSERRLSRGHGERFDAVVWANEVARAALEAPAREFPEGARLVEEAIARVPHEGAPMGLLIMEKGPSGWQFSATGPSGEPADDAGVAACAECHREAPRDFVFSAGLRERARTPAPQ
jgi:hypothetical protein